MVCMASALFSSTASGQVEWTREGDAPVLDVGPPGAWDSRGVSIPWVIKAGPLYKM
jgi:hypothetical protein